MGHFIKQYNLSELDRVAIPGAVTPSLFWAMPTGHWSDAEVHTLWEHFTSGKTLCNEFGLLLVKGGSRGNANKTQDLKNIEAKLLDIIPEGAEEYLSPSCLREDRRVLVLGGAYPQPGWGVLLAWPGSTKIFENLILEATKSVDSNTQKTEVYRHAARAFRTWQNLRTAMSHHSPPDAEIRMAQALEQSIRRTQAAMTAGEYSALLGSLSALCASPHSPSLSQLNTEPLKSLYRELQGIAAIKAVPPHILATEIEPKVDLLLLNPDLRERTLKQLPTRKSRVAVIACLRLAERGVKPPDCHLSDWVEQAYTRVMRLIGEGILRLSAVLAETHDALQERKKSFEQEQERLERRCNEAHQAFRQMTEKATQLQWELGPELLVRLEQACRSAGIWTRSIPWDPARMVGWKVWASGVELRILDLQGAAKKLAPDACKDPVRSHNSPVADGSYFTDYVHSILTAKTGASARTVTKSILVHLLRPAEMMELLRKHGGEEHSASDEESLAEDVLVALGWRSYEPPRERTLAGLINTIDGGVTTLAGSFNGNEFRIVLESFCKDLLDVVVATLGWSNTDVWNEISLLRPHYRPSSSRRDWDEEMQNLTLGAARLLLGRLGPLAFPNRGAELSACLDSLRRLTDILNPLSHHQEDVRPDRAQEVPALIAKLLADAESALGELPWHLEVSRLHVGQPMVVAGLAWSHGQREPRELEVLCRNNPTPGRHLMVWNKNRRNPIITDGLFVRRPTG